MKVTLHFKTPDVTDQLGYLTEDDMEEYNNLFKKFIQYGENISVEFDTEAQTATVKKLY